MQLKGLFVLCAFLLLQEVQCKRSVGGRAKSSGSSGWYWNRKKSPDPAPKTQAGSMYPKQDYGPQYKTAPKPPESGIRSQHAGVQQSSANQRPIGWDVNNNNNHQQTGGGWKSGYPQNSNVKTNVQQSHAQPGGYGNHHQQQSNRQSLGWNTPGQAQSSNGASNGWQGGYRAPGSSASFPNSNKGVGAYPSPVESHIKKDSAGLQKSSPTNTNPIGWNVPQKTAGTHQTGGWNSGYAPGTKPGSNPSSNIAGNQQHSGWNSGYSTGTKSGNNPSNTGKNNKPSAPPEPTLKKETAGVQKTNPTNNQNWGNNGKQPTNVAPETKSYANPVHNQQGYSNPGYGIGQQGYPNQGYPNQGGFGQGYPNQGYGGYGGAGGGYGHNPGYGGYGGGYGGQPGYGGYHGGGFGTGGMGGYGGFGGGYGPTVIKKSGGFGSTVSNVLAGMFIYHAVSSLTSGLFGGSHKRPYNVYNYYTTQNNTTVEEIKLPSNILTLCDANVTTLCTSGTISICTTNGTVLCVASMSNASPCEKGQGSGLCVNTTIPCLDKSDPICQNITNEKKETNVNMPCFTNLTVDVNLLKDGAPSDSNNNYTYCVTTMAVAGPEYKNCTELNDSNDYKSVLMKNYEWWLETENIRRPYTIFNFDHRTDASDDITMPIQVLTRCPENSTKLCAPGLTPSCTSFFEIMCVAAIADTGVCNNTEITNTTCVKQIEQEAVEGQITFDKPCFANITIDSPSPNFNINEFNGTLPVVGNSSYTYYYKYCVVTLALPGAETDICVVQEDAKS